MANQADKAISDFLYKSTLFDFYMKNASVDLNDLLFHSGPSMKERTQLYIEMMAAHFKQATGLEWADIELVQQVEHDQVIWYFQKRGSRHESQTGNG